MGQFVQARESPEERAARIAREKKAAQERERQRLLKLANDNKRVAAVTDRLSRPAAAQRNVDPQAAAQAEARKQQEKHRLAAIRNRQAFLKNVQNAAENDMKANSEARAKRAVAAAAPKRK